MDNNLNVLVEAKREYMGQLCLLMCPVMIETFQDVYEEANKLSKGRKVLVMYQKLLKEVPNWSEAMSKQHTDNIANRCAWFNDLLAAVFVSCVKILSAVRLGKGDKKIALKLPTNEVFVQSCYNNAARDLYQDPYIYHDEQSEYERNDKLFERFSNCIENTVKELTPVQQILQTYMKPDDGRELDLNDANVGDSEDPDVYSQDEEEPMSEQPMGEPMGEQPMGEPMGEQPMGEPMGEQPMGEQPMGEQPMDEPMDEQMGEHQPQEQPYVPQQRSSPFENEFKTINTSGRQQQGVREDGVLFPDASDTRTKKVGYY